MVWERRYFGANEGWVNLQTKDLIYTMHRNGWEVILNGKIALRDLKTEKEAIIRMEDCMDKIGEEYENSRSM